jgi:hypothetical protein
LSISTAVSPADISTDIPADSAAIVTAYLSTMVISYETAWVSSERSTIVSTVHGPKCSTFIETNWTAEQQALFIPVSPTQGTSH